MSKSDFELEKEAEELEKLSQVEFKKKNFNKSILLLKDANYINRKLGFKGQVTKNEQKIAQMKGLISREDYSKRASLTQDVARTKFEAKGDKGEELLENAMKMHEEKNYDIALKYYQEALKIFEKHNDSFQCKQIKWQINKAEKHQPPAQIKRKKRDLEVKKELTISEKRRLEAQKEIKEQKERLTVEKMKEKVIGKELSMAEQRRIKIQKQIEDRTKQEDKKREELERIAKREEEKVKAIQSDKEKLKEMEEKKKKEEEMVKDGEEALQLGKLSLKNNEFDMAKMYYTEANNIFKTLGWFDQVGVIYEEIKNIDKYKTEYLKKIREKDRKQEESDKLFQKCVEEIKTEKELKIKEEEEKAFWKSIPPELKQSIEKAKMLMEKAEREVEMNKFQRALGRYKYILELYESIPKEKIDFSSQISEIKSKISELKTKK